MAIMTIEVVHILKQEIVHRHVFEPIQHEHKFINPLTVILKEEKPKLQGGDIVYIVKDNNPDVLYLINPGQVTDAEGNVIEGATLTFSPVSSDPNVVALTPDPENPLRGIAHFGAPGTANINVTAALADGTIVGSFGSQFTVTVGDPAAMSGGSIAFEGLTEV